MFSKQKVGNSFAVLFAEFLGTGVLTYVFLRLQHSSIGVPYFIAVAAGLALAAATFMFVGKSGAHLNPAITVGMWTARQIKTLPAALYIVAQLFGAWVAYELFHYLFSQPVQSLYTGQPGFDVKIFAAEAVGMLVFALGWAAALHRTKVGHAFAGYVGVVFAVGVLIASVASFGLINPALALGTRAWHIWSGAGWGTYVLGSVVGSVVGFNLYDLFFKDNATGVKVFSSLVGGTSASSASTAKTTSRTTTKKSSSRKKR